MDLFLVSSSAHVIQQMGFGAAVGDILLFPYPDRRISEEQRITPPYTWFSPSDWEPRTCFDSTSGIMVKHVNQHGIYFPKNRAPYTPQ